MNKPKHTPGPWTIGRDGANEYKIHFKGQDRAMQRSVARMVLKIEDARLIAASPDLLAELIRTVKTIEGLYVQGVPEEVRLIAQRSLAAINKATGGAE